MIGIDTNVLVRYIVQDIPEQSKIANEFIEKKLSSSSPGFISQIVLCEIVWVLRRAYEYEKQVIVQILEQILSSSELIVENSDCAWKAMLEYKKGAADFSDYFIGHISQKNGCKFTFTFDKKASKDPLFKLCC